MNRLKYAAVAAVAFAVVTLPHAPAAATNLTTDTPQSANLSSRT